MLVADTSTAKKSPTTSAPVHGLATSGITLDAAFHRVADIEFRQLAIHGVHCERADWNLSGSQLYEVRFRSAYEHGCQRLLKHNRELFVFAEKLVDSVILDRTQTEAINVAKLRRRQVKRLLSEAPVLNVQKERNVPEHLGPRGLYNHLASILHWNVLELFRRCQHVIDEFTSAFGYKVTQFGPHCFEVEYHLNEIGDQVLQARVLDTNEKRDEKRGILVVRKCVTATTTLQQRIRSTSLDIRLRRRLVAPTLSPLPAADVGRSQRVKPVVEGVPDFLQPATRVVSASKFAVRQETKTLSQSETTVERTEINETVSHSLNRETIKAAGLAISTALVAPFALAAEVLACDPVLLICGRPVAAWDLTEDA